MSGLNARPLTIFAGKEILELTEAVEQMDTIIFKTGKNAGAGIGRQGKVFEMAFEGARVEELTWGFEEPGVVGCGIVDDEISHVGGAPVLVGVNDGSMREECPIGILEFERRHAGRVTAQIALCLGAKLATYITGESPFAAAEGRLIEAYVALPADERKLYRIQYG